jgi:hypothetical protein
MLLRITPHVIKGDILPFLTSIDTLALKHSHPQFVEPCRGVDAQLSEMKSNRIHYWRWLFDTIQCECGVCSPMDRWYYWLGRNASANVLRRFVMDSRYIGTLNERSVDLCSFLEGAVASGNMVKAIIVRGNSPVEYFPRALVTAAEFNHTVLFKWLSSLGDLPNIPMSKIKIAYHIGRHGNHWMLSWLHQHHPTFLDDDHLGHLLRQLAINGHEPVVASFVMFFGVDLFDREIFDLSIMYDCPMALRGALSNTVWPTLEDSELLMVYQAKKCAQLWVELGLPILGHVQRWVDRIHS